MSPVLAEIITIGDELLIGQVVDTNSAWIGQRLNEIGVKVHQITSVSDNTLHITKALNDAISRTSVILITGGLGPTKDDITKKTLCEFFQCGLRFDEVAYANIKRLFNSRGKTVTPTNRTQAELPECCITLLNPSGTAPGMWFEKSGRIIISMPGVPYEMKDIMQSEVLPRLQQFYQLPPVLHRTILTQGIGESYLSDLISTWENNLPEHIKLAYLPSPGLVRLRLTATGKQEELLREEIKIQEKQLLELIGDYVYGFDDDTLETIIGQLLRNRKMTIATAESCTGGYIAHRITSVPGSSEYFLGAVIAYANQIKTNELNVASDIIKNFGAVSEQVVKLMAENVRTKFNTNYSIAVSGIAGPGGGSEEKPVGLVYIAVAGPKNTQILKLNLGSTRERIIRETALYAMNALRKILLAEV